MPDFPFLRQFLRRRLPWLTLTLGALALLIHWLPELAAALEYRRDGLAAGGLHRLLGGHLTHWSATHLAYDLAAFLVLGIAVEGRSRGRWWAGWKSSPSCIWSGRWWDWGRRWALGGGSWSPKAREPLEDRVENPGCDSFPGGFAVRTHRP